MLKNKSSAVIYSAAVSGLALIDQHADNEE